MKVKKKFYKKQVATVILMNKMRDAIKHYDIVDKVIYLTSAERALCKI